jgi:hypothetical protein
MQECATECTIIDGTIYAKRSYGLSEPYGLYVDPRDGLIHVNDRRTWKSERAETVDGLLYYRRGDGRFQPLDRAQFRRGRLGRYPLKVIGDLRAMQIDGIWYWIMSDVVPPAIVVSYIEDGIIRYRTVTFPRYDFIRADWVTEGRYYCEKRQLSSRDLRRHGLQNEYSL